MGVQQVNKGLGIEWTGECGIIFMVLSRLLPILICVFKI